MAAEIIDQEKLRITKECNSFKVDNQKLRKLNGKRWKKIVNLRKLNVGRRKVGICRRMKKKIALLKKRNAMLEYQLSKECSELLDFKINVYRSEVKMGTIKGEYDTKLARAEAKIKFLQNKVQSTRDDCNAKIMTARNDLKTAQELVQRVGVETANIYKRLDFATKYYNVKFI